MSPSAIIIIILCVALSALLIRFLSLRESERIATRHQWDLGLRLAQCKRSLDAVTAERDVLARSFETAMKRTPDDLAEYRRKKEATWGYKDADVLVGEHCWALMGEDLVVVMKWEDGGYQVCGPWECGCPADTLQILEIIPRPEGQKDRQLCYSPSEKES
jgi:hypothetical protein